MNYIVLHLNVIQLQCINVFENVMHETHVDALILSSQKLKSPIRRLPRYKPDHTIISNGFHQLKCPRYTFLMDSYRMTAQFYQFYSVTILITMRFLFSPCLKLQYLPGLHSLFACVQDRIARCSHPYTFFKLALPLSAPSLTSFKSRILLLASSKSI